MKVKVLYFDNDDPYFHLCKYIHESKLKGKMRWFREARKGQTEGWLSIHKHCDSGGSPHIIANDELFDYLMDKLGTLEGTYAEWEI